MGFQSASQQVGLGDGLRKKDKEAHTVGSLQLQSEEWKSLFIV